MPVLILYFLAFPPAMLLHLYPFWSLISLVLIDGFEDSVVDQSIYVPFTEVCVLSGSCLLVIDTKQARRPVSNPLHVPVVGAVR